MMTIIRNSGDNKQTTIENLRESEEVDDVENYIKTGYSSSYSRLDSDLPSVTITVNFIHPASRGCQRRLYIPELESFSAVNVGLNCTYSEEVSETDVSTCYG